MKYYGVITHKETASKVHGPLCATALDAKKQGQVMAKELNTLIGSVKWYCLSVVMVTDNGEAAHNG